jgi:hypothetical protein
MDLEKTNPLSSDEAKERLRQAIDDVGLHAWVRRRPYEALAWSFAAGLVMAVSKPMRDAMMKMLMRIL